MPPNLLARNPLAVNDQKAAGVYERLNRRIALVQKGTMEGG